MKNSSLVLFAALILLGWTSLAAGVIAAFAAEPTVSMKVHPHEPPQPAQPRPALYSDSEGPCPAVTEAPDASVPCEA